jgi:hypothetical protein
VHFIAIMKANRKNQSESKGKSLQNEPGRKQSWLDAKQVAQEYPYWVAGGCVVAGSAVGTLLAKGLRRIATATHAGYPSNAQSIYNDAQTEGFDTQYTGAYPRGSGAYSEVMGGHPEDANEMPAAMEPSAEGPIYDGSQKRDLVG